MAVKPRPDGLDIDIDKILAESEARLATIGTTLQAVEKLEVAPTSVHVPAPEHQSAAEINKVSQSSAPALRIAKVEQKKRKGVKDNAGPEFFHMPRTNLTPQLKRDLQVLRMRSVLALGKQHFKKDTRKDPIPEFSQVGQIIEGHTDGSSARLSRRERKRTIVEEVLGGDGLDKFKAKYNVIQERKMSGKKAHYKKLMARRRRG